MMPFPAVVSRRLIAAVLLALGARLSIGVL